MSQRPAPYPNPHDPRMRTDLSARERIVLEFTARVIHGDDIDLIDLYCTPDYIQHTEGIGQGREGLRRFVTEITTKRAERRTWRPIHLFEAGDFVILHKLLPTVVIADFFRFNDRDEMAEHWDVVQPIPSPGYDPLRPSEENLERFRILFGIPG